METINLFGAGGHCKVITEIIRGLNGNVGFIYDDNPNSAKVFGIEVKRASNAVVKGPMIISVGSNKARMAIAKRFAVDFANAVDKTAIISPSATIGCGSVVMAGAIIQSDARIGKHCIVNTGASVDHECIIEDYVHISPHATLCGNVEVGEGAWIGAGATIIPGVKIGRWAIVGAGSVVLHDVTDGLTVYGNPAR